MIINRINLEKLGENNENEDFKGTSNDYITCFSFWNGDLVGGTRFGNIFIFDIETLEYKHKKDLHSAAIKKMLALGTTMNFPEIEENEVNEEEEEGEDEESPIEKETVEFLFSACFDGHISCSDYYDGHSEISTPHKDALWDAVLLPDDWKINFDRKVKKNEPSFFQGNFEDLDVDVPEDSKKKNKTEKKSFIKSHYILTCSSDKTLKFNHIEFPDIKVIETKVVKCPMVSLSLSPTNTSKSKYWGNGFIFAADLNRDIHVFDLHTLETLYTFDSLHEGWVTSIHSFYSPKLEKDILEKRLLLASISESKTLNIHLINNLIVDKKKLKPINKKQKKRIKTIIRRIDDLHSENCNLMVPLRYHDYCDNQENYEDYMFVLTAGKFDHCIKRVNLSVGEITKSYPNIHSFDSKSTVRSIFQDPNNPKIIISSDWIGNIVRWSLEDDIKRDINSERLESLDKNLFVKYPPKELFFSRAIPSSKKKKKKKMRTKLVEMFQFGDIKDTEKMINTKKVSLFSIVKELYLTIRKLNQFKGYSKNEDIFTILRKRKEDHDKIISINYFTPIEEENKKDIYMILKIDISKNKNKKKEISFICHKDVILYSSDFIFKTINFGGMETTDFEEKRTVTLEIEELRNYSVMMSFLEFLYLKKITSCNFGTLLKLFHFSGVYFENDLRDYIFEKIKVVSRYLVRNLLFEMNIIEYGYLIDNEEVFEKLVEFWGSLEFMSVKDLINSTFSSSIVSEEEEELLLTKKQMEKKKKVLNLQMSKKTKQEIEKRERIQMQKMKNEEERNRLIRDFNLKDELIRLIQCSRSIHGEGKFYAFDIDEKIKKKSKEEIVKDRLKIPITDL